VTRAGDEVLRHHARRGRLGRGRLGAAADRLHLREGSPRAITPEAARAIAATLPPFLQRVGVFVDLPAAEVRAIADTSASTAVQLHGRETRRTPRRRGRA
jgi:phosphoribosylanthranilate isomerase